MSFLPFVVLCNIISHRIILLIVVQKKGIQFPNIQSSHNVFSGKEEEEEEKDEEEEGVSDREVFKEVADAVFKDEKNSTDLCLCFL